MAHDTRSRPRGGKKSLNLSANQELKKVLNLQIVATHYQASFPYTQVLSFEINKLTALAVLNGLREAAAAAAPAAI